ncbi:MAG: hypothetical protein ACPKPY_03765 [Nitrososphaeraceae archaeon]
MRVIKITKSNNKYRIQMYRSNSSNNIDEDIQITDEYELNFLLQTIQKKHDVKKCLIIFHDTITNNVDFKFLHDEQDFFWE